MSVTSEIASLNSQAMNKPMPPPVASTAQLPRPIAATTRLPRPIAATVTIPTPIAEQRKVSILA